VVNNIKYWHIENKGLIKDAKDSSDNALTYDVILNLDWECCELLAKVKELEKQLAGKDRRVSLLKEKLSVADRLASESLNNKSSEWNRYNIGMALDCPEKLNCRRVLLLIDDPNCGIYDFVVSAHQDFDGGFWTGVPGKWVSINSNWIIKAWQPAPAPRVEGHTKESEL
jgi:hypothetical protein